MTLDHVEFNENPLLDVVSKSSREREYMVFGTSESERLGRVGKTAAVMEGGGKAAGATTAETDTAPLSSPPFGLNQKYLANDFEAIAAGIPTDLRPVRRARMAIDLDPIKLLVEMTEDIYFEIEHGISKSLGVRGIQIIGGLLREWRS